MKLSEIAEIIETLAPKNLALEWDNVGLIIGDKDREIKKAVVSLDFNCEVLEYAVKENVDLIITHHPAIFGGIKSITDKNYLKCIENKISVYSAHTNLDVAEGGVNDALSEVLGLKDVESFGMLRVGKTEKCMAEKYIEHIKTVLSVPAVRVSGDLKKQVEKVGLIGGAGGEDVTFALEKGCDLYLTGEAKYHEAQFASDNDIVLVTAGHYETEICVVNKLAKYLEENTNIEIIPFIEKNIYKVI